MAKDKEDLSKISKKNLENKISVLKRKGETREDIGKILATISLSFGAITSIVLSSFIIPFISTISVSVISLFIGWGIYASGVKCSLEVDELTKELKSREEYTQLSMEKVLEETFIKKSNNRTNNNTKIQQDENNLTL